MTQIALEVGETYLNKKGDMVRITKRQGTFRKSWIYKGSDGFTYRENGRTRFMFNRDYDLVEVSKDKMFDNLVDALFQALKKRAA